MIGIELVKDKTTKEPFPELTKQLIKDCLKQNLIIISCGLHDNVIRLIPPLIIDKKTLLKGLEIFVKTIKNDY